MRTVEQDLDARQARRMAAEHRYLSRLERLEKAAAPLVGELCRDGKTVFYINIKDRSGKFTGKVKESAMEYELISYLIRNHYVTVH